MNSICIRHNVLQDVTNRSSEVGFHKGKKKEKSCRGWIENFSTHCICKRNTPCEVAFVYGNKSGIRYELRLDFQSVFTNI